MRSLILSTMAILALGVSAAASADTDSCQPMRDQYDQVCSNPQATTKQGAILMAAACAMEAIAIRKCESQNDSEDTPPADDDGDGSQ